MGPENLFDLHDFSNYMGSKYRSFTLTFQRIRASIDEKAQKQLLKELEIVMKTSDCPFIVNFYGAIFKEVCFFFSFKAL